MADSTIASSSSSSPAAAAATVEDLPADVLRLVLRRLDGASLAALGAASSAFRGLADDPDTWRALCLAAWPSVRGLPSTLFSGAGGRAYWRTLYADAFPFPSSTSGAALPGPATCTRRRLPARLVSAVDLCHGGVQVMSRVVDTDATCPWFLGSPFRVDALLQEGFTILTPSSSPAPAAFSFAPEELTLSWILIDPATGRALNASSRRPVRVDRPPRWLGNGDAVARFCVVIAGAGEEAVAMEAAVTCDGGGRGHVREVSLTCASMAEEGGGGGVSGEDALAAVAAALAGRRRCGRRGEEDEEARRRSYEEFGRRKRERKERKKRREGAIDLCCSGVVGAAALVAFLVLLVFR